MSDASSYMSGFGNSFETEALPGALPAGRNSPQKCPYGLYAEQLSGTAFTMPQASNQRSWLYRIRPGVKHAGRFTRVDAGLLRTAPAARDESALPLGQLRWAPVAIPAGDLSFVTGLCTVTTAGDADTRSGMAAHYLFVTRSMRDEYFMNCDGELLIVVQENSLRLVTEFGVIEVSPGEICAIPRGVIFRAELIGGPVRGYVCENYGASFTLPDRGPIGANCLANPRDFLVPVAAYEDREAPSLLFAKWGGEVFRSEIAQSPLDVVAWHAENTFRPPWYHRNIMSEFMGLIYGVYDAKPEGFRPGGMSLHNSMLPHGPDEAAFEHASNAELKPVKQAGTMAFMFETRFPQRVTKWASELPALDEGYPDCWSGLRRRFDPSRRDPA
jgi:homogentisate 1,2-dioxygenase